MIRKSHLQKFGVVIFATLGFIVLINLDVRQWRVYCYCSTGTIAPLVKAPNISDHKSGGGEGLKMMVTISCVLVGIAVIFTGLLMLRRRRREQRLKRLRGERRAVSWHSLDFLPVKQMFSLFILQMPKVWLKCSWGKCVHNRVVVAKKDLYLHVMKVLLCLPVKTHVHQNQLTNSSKPSGCTSTSREPSCWSRRETPWRLSVGSTLVSSTWEFDCCTSDLVLSLSCSCPSDDRSTVLLTDNDFGDTQKQKSSTVTHTVHYQSLSQATGPLVDVSDARPGTSKSSTDAFLFFLSRYTNRVFLCLLFLQLWSPFNLLAF